MRDLGIPRSIVSVGAFVLRLPSFFFPYGRKLAGIKKKEVLADGMRGNNTEEEEENGRKLAGEKIGKDNCIEKGSRGNEGQEGKGKRQRSGMITLDKSAPDGKGGR